MWKPVIVTGGPALGDEIKSRFGGQRVTMKSGPSKLVETREIANPEWASLRG
jgi:hypothetical protein